MNQFKIIILIIIYTIFLIYFSINIERNKNNKEKLDICYKNRDTFYKISRQYYVRSYNLNYDESNLITIQDKINYLTIHEFPDYKSKIVDKIRLHEYSKKVLGKDICVPILKVYNNANDIDLDELPNKFVLKCNHGSQMNIICKNKNNFNLNQAKILLNNWMNINYAEEGFEFQYLNVKKQIFAETFLKDNVEDYKIYCFHGKAKFIRVQKKGNNGKKINNYYNLNWELTDIETGLNNFYRDPNYIFEKPKNLNLMIEYAKKLSFDFAFVRVDFYNINGTIYLGELTFTPSNARFRLKNKKQSIELGNLIDIKRIKKNIFN